MLSECTPLISSVLQAVSWWTNAWRSYDDETAVSAIQHRHRKKAKLGSEDVSARATPTGTKEEETQSGRASSTTLTSTVDANTGDVEMRTS